MSKTTTQSKKSKQSIMIMDYDSLLYDYNLQKRKCDLLKLDILILENEFIFSNISNSSKIPMYISKAEFTSDYRNIELLKKSVQENYLLSEIRRKISILEFSLNIKGGNNE